MGDDREALAELIYSEIADESNNTLYASDEFGLSDVVIDGRNIDLLAVAERILARWRLVPVDQEPRKNGLVQQEFLALYFQGMTDQQLGEQLGVPTRTVAKKRRELGLDYNDGKGRITPAMRAAREAQDRAAVAQENTRMDRMYKEIGE